jgi:HPt (histidine-containing phosphotransfer) domain-containing protein
MIGDIANEFESITKFSLLDFFVDYRNFLQNDYADVYSYFSGSSETIDVNKLTTLSGLLNRSNDLIRAFQTFSGKLGNVGYWELQQYCQDLKDTLERINKLPKYCRTAKTCRGYKPYVQIKADIGGMKTIQDVATEIGGTMSEEELIMNNDLQEQDYEIDSLSSINALVDNSTDTVVSTIMEQPIGSKIYGRDINRKISFSGNDLALVEYEDNVEQKCNILLELNVGDVPEFPQFGKSLTEGTSMYKYNYAELVEDIRSTFLQDDLFADVNVVDINPDKTTGEVYITFSIQTQYIYSTTKNMKL